MSLNYIDLISPIVSAIQALSNEITSHRKYHRRLCRQSSPRTNSRLCAGRETRSTCSKLCIGSTCITEGQFRALLAAAGQTVIGPRAQVADSSSDDTLATDTPPQIQINGDNPAIVQVGNTYNDFGATITGPQADLNLGITTYVNGVELSPVQIDTSVAATDTIDYVVTDQNGLTSTSTRTVIIEASCGTFNRSNRQRFDNCHVNRSMINSLIFDNLTYIAMPDATAGSHLSTEYLARLARTGRLRGRIVAHMWFIEMHSLQQFLCARYRRRLTSADIIAPSSNG